jgi:Holliday junction resolvase-like predicted endonuclease
MIEVVVAREDAKAVIVTVRVREGGGETSHEVTVSRADHARLARAGETVEGLVTRSFEFLLERESKESIMRRFDLMVIARYFPEYEETINASRRP